MNKSYFWGVLLNIVQAEYRNCCISDLEQMQQFK